MTSRRRAPGGGRRRSCRVARRLAACEVEAPAKRVVLAYSGGLDTSVAVRWIRVERGYEVVARGRRRSAQARRRRRDPRACPGRRRGRGRGDQRPVRGRDPRPRCRRTRCTQGYPLAVGAVPAGDRGASRRVGSPPSCRRGWSRLHGQGQRPGAVRGVVSILAPDLDVLSPVRVRGLTRADCIDLAAKWEIPIEAEEEKLYSIDENMWGRAIECGVLEPVVVGARRAHTLTRSPGDAPSEPCEVVLGFDRACRCRSTARQRISLRIGELARSWAPTDGVGSTWSRAPSRRYLKSREVYECPASLRSCSHTKISKASPSSVMSREKQRVEIRVAELIYDGLWHSPLMGALRAFVTETQKEVTGEVRIAVEAPGRPPGAARASTTTTWPPTTPRTPSATRTQRGSCGSGVSRPKGRAAKARAPCQPGADRRTGIRRGVRKPLWAGRFGEGPADELLAFTVSFRTTVASWPTTSSAPAVHTLERVGAARGAGAAGHLHRARTGGGGARVGHVRVRADRRRHPHRDRTSCHRDRGRDRGQAAHRPQPQRPGRVDLRLYLRREGVCRLLASTRPGRALRRAEEATDVYLPGYTHLQRAQPVLLAHHLLADFWRWAAIRPLARLPRARRRVAARGRRGRVEPAHRLQLVANELGFSFTNSLERGLGS